MNKNILIIIGVGVVAAGAVAFSQINKSPTDSLVPPLKAEITATPTNVQPNVQLNPKEIVELFLKKIGDKQIPEAIAMMSPQAIGDESQKQAWGVQLAAFKKLVINSVVPSMPEGWTQASQSYKVTMDVEMSEESANGPIPYYGYEKGINIRWIVLAKAGNDWKIQGIGTGP
jgi:hypothetical protein